MRRMGMIVAASVALMPLSAVVLCPQASGETVLTEASVAPLLEGTEWPVTVIPDEQTRQQGEKPFDDTLIFKDGKVEMSACVKAGFAPSTYTALPMAGTWSFKTQQASKDQGQTEWTAELIGDSITGTMTWTKTDGSVLRYTFEGEKVDAQHSS